MLYYYWNIVTKIRKNETYTTGQEFKIKLRERGITHPLCGIVIPYGRTCRVYEYMDSVHLFLLYVMLIGSKLPLRIP